MKEIGNLIRMVIMIISVMRKAGTNGMPVLIRTFLLYFFRSWISFSERPWTDFLIVVLPILTSFSSQSPSVSCNGGVRTMRHCSRERV